MQIFNMFSLSEHPTSKIICILHTDYSILITAGPYIVIPHTVQIIMLYADIQVKIDASFSISWNDCE